MEDRAEAIRDILEDHVAPSLLAEVLTMLSKEEEHQEHHSGESVWVNLLGAGVCVCCAALAAGLTMGLLSIEPLEMAIKQKSGTEEEKAQARKILPLVQRHHLLLVTLLLFNSLANEAMPVFLEGVFPPAVAILISVTLVLFFGEIFPSALFTGPAQLKVVSSLTGLVWVLIFAFGALSWPIAKALDLALGVEGLKRYSRADLAALVEVTAGLGHENGDGTELNENGEEPPLLDDEVAIVHGVLKVSGSSVRSAMINIDQVFCLSIDAVLDADTMALILACGYSRILIYEGDDTRNLRGYLQVKRLIVLSPDDNRIIRSLALRLPEVVSPDESLLELLNVFQLGHTHIAMVCKNPAEASKCLKAGVPLSGDCAPLGIITLEDIIEEILQEEIEDESDRLATYIEHKARQTLLSAAKRRRQRRLSAKTTPQGRGIRGRLSIVARSGVLSADGEAAAASEDIRRRANTSITRARTPVSDSRRPLLSDSAHSYGGSSNA
ncbi:unnamed protein product [Chrysoparadoxa australica]